ncbi:polyprenyl synthetase family protein [Streptomyces sp. NPDC005805]|uniref:polyprenyl synthetase family protein n=1 Tax=Streptomyces sp. NPDC005805 TaxID=3157068 RepID=UPI00340C68ED
MTKETLDLRSLHADTLDELASFFLSKMDSQWPTQVERILLVLKDFALRPGKMLRPSFVYCGWAGSGGDPTSLAIRKFAAGIEMFHTFALIHDDVMDQSATRRGRPTVWRALAGFDAQQRHRNGRDQFADNAAILLGDLCLVWSDEMIREAGLEYEAMMRAQPLVAQMRSEIMVGQYLDLLTSGVRQGASHGQTAWEVLLYKTARYTVERPLQIGAALAGAPDSLLHSLSQYAIPLGEAFQLRDDVLGVFGSEKKTGKSRMDDLRAGKATILLGLTYERADSRQLETLDRWVGHPDLQEPDADLIRQIIIDTGALKKVEEIIDERLRTATDLLISCRFPTGVRDTLRVLAESCTHRSV